MSKLKSHLPPNPIGLIIDILSALLSFLVFPFFTKSIKSLFDRSFSDDKEAFSNLSLVMLLILVGRMSGLYLKRFPLQARIAGNKNKYYRVLHSEKAFYPVLFIIFSTPLLIFTVAFVVMLVSYWGNQIFGGEPDYNGNPTESQFVNGVGTIMGITLMIAEICLIFRLTKPLTSKEKKLCAEGNWRFGLKGELLADFGLFAYIIVWQVFYNSFVATAFIEVESKWGPILIIILPLFFVFYVSPRSVFLIEDSRYLLTWIFIAIVFLSSILPHWQ